MKAAFVFVFLFALPCWVGATELEGLITNASGKGAKGAKVFVTCDVPSPGYRQSQVVANNGRYRISDVPDGESCELTIQIGDAKSKPYRFRTKSGKMTLNRQVRKYGNRLVIL